LQSIDYIVYYIRNMSIHPRASAVQTRRIYCSIDVLIVTIPMHGYFTTAI